jgi:glycosyltransferase involved in cell wall biosynthesis
VATPWISILMPTFNGEAYIDLALKSVEAQCDPDIEVIAVDDGSTDQTLAILSAFSDRLNLRIIRRSRVGNWAANVNRALDFARGTYVSILHQDDVWHPGRLARLRSLAALHTDATLFVHPCWFIDERGDRLGPWRCPLPPHVALNPRSVLDRLLIQNFIAMPAPMFPRSVFSVLGGMDAGLWFTPDWDLWLKLASAGPTIYTDEFLADFRLHSSSQTLTRSHDLDDFRRQHTVVLERHVGALDPGPTPLVRGAVALSVEVNATLAAAFHGVPIPYRTLVGTLLKAGPAGWFQYLRVSRLGERVLARLRARMRARLHAPKVAADSPKRRAA